MVTEAFCEAQDVVVEPMASQPDADAFRELNEEWITRYFRLEEKDKRTLNDPAGEIIAKGGRVYVARIGGRRVGCVALIDFGKDGFELSKMAVAPDARGRGVGRRLLQFTIDQARALGVKRIFLGSNSVLANAVHLYESIGFRHVPVEELPHLGYARADVHMAIQL